jgi:uncharacterized membrane protein YuzA (DUF378 family)
MNKIFKGLNWQGVAALTVLAAAGTLIAIFGSGEALTALKYICIGAAGGTLLPNPMRGGKKHASAPVEEPPDV